MLRTLLTLTLTLIVPPAVAQQQVPESVHQGRLCGDVLREVVLTGVGRADCVTDSHAIEVDFSGNWKAGIGQALAYGAATGLRPGLVLICRAQEATCLRHQLGIEQTIAAFGLPLTVWLCLPTDDDLDQCVRNDRPLSAPPSNR